MPAALLVAGAVALPAVSSASTNTDVHQTTPAGLVYSVAGHDGSTVWAAAANAAHPHRLGAGDAGSLSPSGRYVAVIPTSGTGLSIRPAAGGAAITVPSVAHDAVTGIAWAPDSRYLAVSWSGPVTTSPHARYRDGIDVVAVPSGTRVISTVTKDAVSTPSFNPVNSDQLVFAASKSPSPDDQGVLDELTFKPAGKNATGSLGPIRQGRIANPLWTRAGIVFDSVTSRGRFASPVYQLEILRHGTVTQITHMKPPKLEAGLVPVAASRNGMKLITNLVGQDIIAPYTVDLATHRVRQLITTAPVPATRTVTADGISADGTRVLLTYGVAGKNNALTGIIGAAPFAGGTPTVLVRGGTSPSWR